MRFSIIVGYTFNNNGIGYKGQLPWRLKNDMIYFKKKTSNVNEDDNIEYINSVIMGMTTWNSIVEGNKPLKNRLNIIITRKTIKSNNKFMSDCGWPSYESALPGAITYIKDTSLGMVRTEIVCSNCGGHQGHVFDDGPTSTGKRYCVNSASINFINNKNE